MSPKRAFNALIYQEALEAYLFDPNEAALERAYEVGRAALAGGIGVLDLARIHCRATTSGPPRTLEPTAVLKETERGWKFFAEVLAPYEMALRGFSEANARLLQLASSLERRVEERTSALRDSEERYRLLFENTPFPMWVYDLGSLRFLAVNDAAVRHYGYSREEFLAMTIKEIRPADEVPDLEAHLADIEGTAEARTWQHRTKAGAIVTVEVSAHTVDFAGQPARLVLANDVTERRRLEDQMRHAQKMESIGQLAGGVAHDFNNLLAVILVNARFLHQAAVQARDPEQVEEAEEVRKAAERGAALTRQLLAFSRRQVLQPRVLDLNAIIHEMGKMLMRLIGEDIEVRLALDPGLARVSADPGQIEQVVMNLAVNARDAMPRGGRLTIGTANRGDRVVLCVADTGIGIDPEIRTRIFEPFFTTKGVGKGTGLGLATVYGIVSQSGGEIEVVSEPGAGTEFRVVLPRAQDDADAQPARSHAAPSNGTETLLLIEDDNQLRPALARALRAGGYTVLAAANGDEAIAAWDKQGGSIRLVISDMVVPGTSGPEAVSRLRERQPELPALFISGHTDHPILEEKGAEAVHFLQKPFSLEALAAKVREILDDED